MKKSVAILVLITLGLGSGIAWFTLREETVSFAPRWEVGQAWRVQVVSGQDDDTGPGPTYSLWNFSVTGKEKIGEAIFYTIQVSTEEEGQLRFELDFMYPDLSLIRVATYKNSRLVGQERVSSSTFLLNARAARVIPLDFLALPTYNLSSKQRKTSLGLEKEEVITDGPSPIRVRYEFDQHILDTGAVKTLKITAADSQKKIASYQFWEAGRPWWTNAKRNIDGRLVSEGVLVDDPAF